MFDNVIASYKILHKILTRRNLNTVAAIFFCLVTSSFTNTALAADCELSPTADIKPQTVIKTVIDALKSNSDNDDGIAQVFCFASPENKKMTGPIERFASMIKRGYGDMLNHIASEYEPIEIDGKVAQQRVWLETADGSVVGYLFRLGKQSSGEFSDMWMTDAVYRLDPSERKQSI